MMTTQRKTCCGLAPGILLMSDSSREIHTYLTAIAKLICVTFQETTKKTFAYLFYAASARGIHLSQQSSPFDWKLVLTWRDYGKCFRELG